MKKIEMKAIQTNHSLLNIITPITGIEYKQNKMRIGDNYAKIYTIIKYPKNVKVGWLSKIANIPNTISMQLFEPSDNTLLIENMSKGIRQSEMIYDTAKDTLVRKRALREIDDGQEILDKVEVKGETVGYMTLMIMVVAEDEETLNKRCKRVESIICGMQLKMRSLANLLRQSFHTIAPFSTINNTIKKIARRNILMSDFMGGFPFGGGGLNDGKGFILGKDTNGGIVVLDMWKRGLDRVNSNFVIMGTSGVGKSTACKHLLLAEYMKGTRIICVDPEREYKTMCQNLGGDWINTIGKNGQMINPLQIKPVPLDDEDEDIKGYKDEGNGLGAMALHIQNIRPFFKLLFPEITHNQMTLLIEHLEKLYNKFGIFWSTDITTLKNTDFPILKDLYEFLIKHIEELEKTNTDLTDYKVVAGLLREVAIGADSEIFNGHTTVQANSKCIVLDTFSLQNSDERIKKAQYYNILTYCWEQMSKDKEQRTLLVCDEAYLMISPDCPQSLIFLRNIAKRCRKYNGAICIISHSVVDFLDPSVKMYGQAILDMACYKILMGSDGQNLEEMKILYKLTEAEYDLIYARQMGVALFMAGTSRLSVKFDIFPYEFDYIDKKVV